MAAEAYIEASAFASCNYENLVENSSTSVGSKDKTVLVVDQKQAYFDIVDEKH